MSLAGIYNLLKIKKKKKEPRKGHLNFLVLKASVGLCRTWRSFKKKKKKDQVFAIWEEDSKRERYFGEICGRSKTRVSIKGERGGR